MATLAFISEPAGSEKFRTTGKFHCPFPRLLAFFFWLSVLAALLANGQ